MVTTTPATVVITVDGVARRSRTLVLAEALGAVVLTLAAWWCWQRGVIVTVRRGVPMSHIVGGWWASATAAATLAGLLLLDAGRRMRR